MKSFFNKYIFMAVVALGIVFRLICIEDMEWKYDEQHMFSQALEIYNTGKIPDAGMKSGGGIENPPLSMLVFTALVPFAKTPIAMARAVQIINIFSLLALILFIRRRFRGEDQSLLLWGVVIASVNPIAVVFSRKIWAQDVLPLFSLLVILGHAYRNKIWGLLLWGFVGALIGQIHMSGFFYAFALVSCTLVYDLLNKRRVKWQYWFLGSALGTVPMIGWVNHILTGESTQYAIGWKNIIRPNFWEHYLGGGFGLNSYYSLGNDVFTFFKWPYLASMPTYIIGFLHLIVLITALVLFVNFIVKILGKISSMGPLNWFASLNETSFYLFSLCFFLGLLFHIMLVRTHAHYLIITFPFVYVLAARIIYPRRMVLVVVVCAQILFTAMFLNFIHVNGGSSGDYGSTYISQQQK